MGCFSRLVLTNDLNNLVYSCVKMKVSVLPAVAVQLGCNPVSGAASKFYMTQTWAFYQLLYIYIYIYYLFPHCFADSTTDCCHWLYDSFCYGRIEFCIQSLFKITPLVILDLVFGIVVHLVLFLHPPPLSPCLSVQ